MLNKFTKIILILLIFVMINDVILVSQENNTNVIATIKVKTAIEYAIENNPELKKHKNLIESLKSLKISEIAPSKTNISYLKEGIGNDILLESRWTITQDFEFPLKSIYHVESRNREIEAMELKYSEKVLGIKENIKKVYTNLAYSLQIFKIKQQQMRIADSLSNAVLLRLEAGFATEPDHLKAEIFFDNTKNELKEAEVNLHTARYALFNLMGLDPDKQTYNIIFPDTLSYFDISIVQKEVLKKIYDFPGYKSSELIIKSKEKSKDKALSDFFPDFELSFYNQSFLNDKTYGYEIGVKLPVWFFLDQNNKISNVDMEIEYAQNELFEKYLELKKEIEYSWHGYDISRKKIQLYQSSLREKSAKLLELTFEAYKAGTTDLINLLDAQRIYLENEIKYFGELRDFYIRVTELEKFINEEIVFER